MVRLRAERDAWFYKTHAGAELDLLIERGGHGYGFEFKFTDAPKLTKSMRMVMDDLKLKRLFVVYPGGSRYPLEDKIEVVPLSAVQDTISI